MWPFGHKQQVRMLKDHASWVSDIKNPEIYKNPAPWKHTTKGKGQFYVVACKQMATLFSSVSHLAKC